MRQGNNGRRPRGGRPNRRPGPLKAQTFDSNGPDVRIRGNAHQVYERYLSLARDCMTSGDRVLAESYYQFAEHYYRIIHESTDPESPGSHRPHFRDPRYENRDGEGEDFGGDDQGYQPQGEAAPQQHQQNRQPHQQHRQQHQPQGPQGPQQSYEGQQHRQAPRPPAGEPRSESDDREGLERALRGGSPRGEVPAEVEAETPPPPVANGDAQAAPRGRGRYRRRFQNTDEGESTPGRRSFPPRAGEEAEPAGEASGHKPGNGEAEEV